MIFVPKIERKNNLGLNIMAQVDKFNTPKCSGVIHTDSDGWEITVQGVCQVNASSLRYAAASPPDLRMSRAGSGLPFPNDTVAYEGSPNVGEVPVSKGRFSFKVTCPNSYYTKNGSELVKPHVHVTVGTEYIDIPLASARVAANRSLTSMPGRSKRSTGR